jgi:hypothetical protein
MTVATIQSFSHLLKDSEADFDEELGNNCPFRILKIRIGAAEARSHYAHS